MAWRLAKGLIRLREQIDKRWPGRSKASDGSIGDEAHASRTSDHNPWLKIAGVGVVTAIDITHAPTTGPDGNDLSQVLTDDYRTKYVIFNGRIWKARTRVWEPYRGPNRHEHHVHISINPTLCDHERPWAIAADLDPRNLPLLKYGSRGEAVRQLQQVLVDAGFTLNIDGIFGPATRTILKIYQEREGVPTTGVTDVATWEKLMTYR